MTKAERTALIYGLSVAGAAVVSYSRGRRGMAELGMDAAVHGGIVGTGINVVVYLQEDASEKSEVGAAKAILARQNQGQKDCSPLGKLTGQGLSLLSAINPEVLYKTAKMVGVSIGPEGDDPHKVVLPAD